MTRDRTPDRFDEELRRAARALAAEPLPAGVLDPSLTERATDGAVHARRPLPGLAPAATVVALLILATAVALSPGGPAPSESAGHGASPSRASGPLFRPTTEIVSRVSALGYACSDGMALPTGRPSSDVAVRESAICATPKDDEPLFAAIILAESAARVVVRISFKADIVGDDTPASREAVATELAKLVDGSLLEAAAAAAVGDAIESRLPRLEPADAPVATDVAGLHISLERHEAGTYLVHMVDPDAR